MWDLKKLLQNNKEKEEIEQLMNKSFESIMEFDW